MFFHGFPLHHSNTKNALAILQEHKLVLFRGDSKQANADITPLGEKVIKEFLGIENYINNLTKNTESKEILEFEKLKGDVEKLKYDISISKDTPKNNRTNRVIAIISISIAFLSLVLSLVALMIIKK